MSERFPTPNNEKESPQSLENFDQLKELTGEIDIEILEGALTRLKKELTDLPEVGRTLEEQLGSHRKEFVIPLTSAEQKERILDALFDLGIFPWEENGLLIVEHTKDLRKLGVAGILDTKEIILPAPEGEEKGNSSATPSVSSENDPFIFPSYKPGSSIFPKDIEGSRRPKEVGETPNEESGIDTELQDLIRKFDQGLIDEDDPQIVARLGDIPTLTLFPRQYIWENGSVKYARSGEPISKETLQEWREAAREGDVRAMETCLRVHTGLALSVLGRIKRLWPHADADDLFQEGLLGLKRSLELHDPEKGAFSTYAVIHIEARMRRYIQMHEHGDVALPVHRASGRAQYYQGRNALEKMHPDRATSRKELREYLYEKGFRSYSDHSLDKLERALFINVHFDPLDESFGEEITPDEVDMRANPRAEYGLDDRVNMRLDANILYEYLKDLEPRQQLILRLRFALFEGAPMTEEMVKEALSVGERDTKRVDSLMAEIGQFDLESFDISRYYDLSSAKQLLLRVMGKVPDSIEVIHSNPNSMASYDGLSLGEMGNLFGRSGALIGQTEAKALRILSHPARMGKLKHLVAGS